MKTVGYLSIKGASGGFPCKIYKFQTGNHRLLTIFESTLLIM